jgi:hypothetical protein
MSSTQVVAFIEELRMKFMIVCIFLNFLDYKNS